MHDGLVMIKDAVCRLVGAVYQAANFTIDLTRCLFGEVAVLCDLPSKKDLLFFFAEGEWSETAHAVFADHLPA